MATTSDGGGGSTAAGASEDRSSGFWNLLPGFDPSSDDPREYRDKVQFLHKVCPPKDRGMLAPRLALLCKGTAWSQVKQIDASKLTDPESGVTTLLKALETWDESAELQTYEKFEKAIYRTLQKQDESTMSFVNRLGVAFHDLGDTMTIKQLHAFILLRQSALTAEDKRKVITLSGGDMEVSKVEQAMRTLSTRILSMGGDIKKKTYPANFAEEDDEEALMIEEEADEDQLLANLAEAGDEDAVFIMEYEEQLLDLVQEVPELASCFSAYTAARQRLRDRQKGRGFWPPRGGKGGKGKGGKKGGRGGTGQPFRKSLAERIANSNCRICGQRGHWRAECPQQKGSQGHPSGSASSEASNLVLFTTEANTEPEIVDRLPQNLGVPTTQKKKEKVLPVPALIQEQHELMFYGQHENLVDHTRPWKAHAASDGQANLRKLRRAWNKLRGNDEHPEQAMFVGRAETAILDTGASKTVAGQVNFDRFVQQLSKSVRDRIHKAPSGTVFRFGNNGTLPSLYAAFVPFGKKWFKIEVVAGQTPFLLSNAVMRQMKCQLNFEEDTLWIPEYHRSLKLSVGVKGLYHVDVVALLEMDGSESALLEVDTTPEANPQHQVSRATANHDDLNRRAPEHAPGCYRRRDLVFGTSSPRAIEQAARSDFPAPMGNLSSSGRPPQGAALSRHLSPASRVRQLFKKSAHHLQVPAQLSVLCQRHRARSEANGGGRDPSRTHAEPSHGEGRRDGCAANDSRADESTDSGRPAPSGAKEGGAKAGSRLELIKEEPIMGCDRRASHTGNGAGQQFRADRGAPDTDCHFAARAEPHSGKPVEVSTCPRKDEIPEGELKCLSPEKLLEVTRAIDQLCLMVEQSIQEINRLHPTTYKARQAESSHRSSMLEISVGFQGMIGRELGETNGSWERIDLARSRLLQAGVPDEIWSKMSESQPRHVWLSIGPKQLSRHEKGVLVQLTRDLYEEQVSRGAHFHLWAPESFVQDTGECLDEVFAGTLPTFYHVGHVPRTERLKGNNYLRQRVNFRTTSQGLHRGLDWRYFVEKGQMEGSRKRVYSLGLSSNVAFWIGRLKDEKPLILNELCCHLDDKRTLDEDEDAGQQAIKRRRCHGKQDELNLYRYGKSHVSWESVFREVNSKVPRAGNFVIPPEDPMIPKVQQLIPEMVVHHMEVCRGVNRLRIPQGRYERSRITHRKTVVINRDTGSIEECGPIEHWARLPKYKQIGAGRHAKIAITVFGVCSDGDQESMASPNRRGPTIDPQAPNASTTNARPELGDQDSEMTSATPEQSGPKRGEPSQKMAWGPPPVANHGPGFLRLNAQEQSEIRQLHHNLGHPDPKKFALYLKQGGADEVVQQGALDFQCDACTESRRGFMAARPAAIHANISFNHKVGMDLVSWRSSKGKEFHFVHFIDEATLFNVGAECNQGAEGVIEMFEQLWVNWAGYPQEVYVDPGGEFISDAWALKMQEAGIKVNMSASDSHWQLGRAEIHGSTVKQMLSRMDLEKGIESSHEFRKALRHVFLAKNSLCRADGYTPQQAVLGVSCRLPGSILSDSNASSHALAESGTSEGGSLPEGQRFLEELQLRERARRSFIMVDNSSSFRRALLRRTRPLRSQWEPGDMVLYWRRRGGNLRREHGRWHGPAQVIAKEKEKVVWLSHAGRLIRASPEQIRAASLPEWEMIPKSEQGSPLQQLEPLKNQLKHAPQYFDLEGEDIPPAEAFNEPASMDVQSEPEAENTPESSNPSRDGLSPKTTPHDDPMLPFDDEPRMPTSAEQASLDQSLEVPVPEDDDLEFGDMVVVEEEEVNFSGVESCWEISIVPPQGWELPKEIEEDMICLASENRKQRVEVKLRDLTIRDQKRFALAKNKEVGAWLSHKTVRKVAQGKIPNKNIMRCRWIYTWKPAEAVDEATHDGKKAKARLVVLGFEDPDIDHVPNDAPTLTKDGRQLLLQKICSNRWRLCSFDISTAFLHGKGDGRLLGIQAPPEVKEALEMEKGDQCELVGGAYGRIDAPYLWYQELRKELLGIGFKQCPLDPCVFSLSTRDASGKLRSHGILGIHVDDGICGGDQVFQEALQKLRKRFSFGSYEQGTFVFTGIRLHQWEDGSIEMDQTEYVSKIEAINVPRERRKNLQDPVTEAERRQYRQLIGSLQYAAVHTRADLCAKIGELQSAINVATVSHLLEANRVLHEAKVHPVTIMIIPIAEQELTFCAFSDASFASNQKLSAHQGTVIFATSTKILENDKSVVCPIAWSSKRIPRVVRSTLGAEAFALSNSIDRLSWIRVLWAWMKDDSVAWHCPEELLRKEPSAAAVTDCKSVYDIVTRTVPPHCEEHRTTIECLLIRQRMQDNCKLRWVASGAMLADCLTKSMDASRLRECLKSGRYTLFDEGMVLKQRADKRKQLQWVKQQKPLDDSCMYSTAGEGDFWRVDRQRGFLERVHRRPRWERFTPIGVRECPVALGDLDARRTTYLKTISSLQTNTVNDVWVGPDSHHTEAEAWIGVTRFYFMSEPKVHDSPSQGSDSR